MTPLKSKAAPKRKPTAKKNLPNFAPTASALCALRANLALSRTTMARKLGVSVATLTKWERAKDSLKIPKPTLSKLTRLQASGKT